MANVNYPNFPRDGSRSTIDTMTPAIIAVAVTYDATISSTTQVTFNAASTMIEVAAIDKTVLMKWGTTSASTSVFDEVIPLNTVRQFFIPVVAATGVLYTAANFIEEAATAKICVVEK